MESNGWTRAGGRSGKWSTGCRPPGHPCSSADPSGPSRCLPAWSRARNPCRPSWISPPPPGRGLWVRGRYFRNGRWRAGTNRTVGCREHRSTQQGAATASPVGTNAKSLGHRLCRALPRSANPPSRTPRLLALRQRRGGATAAAGGFTQDAEADVMDRLVGLLRLQPLLSDLQCVCTRSSNFTPGWRPFSRTALHRAAPRTGPDPALRLGEIRRHPDGRCPSAHHRRTNPGLEPLHRAGARPATAARSPASATARATATEDHRHPGSPPPLSVL